MRRFRAALQIGIVLVSAAVWSPPAAPQDSLASRLFADRVGYVETGAYLAGDRVAFTLDGTGPEYLLRISGSPEVFVLYVDRVSLGGRILKYDSGETAIKVSGWGGMTLYTDAVPGGLPAERTGDSTPPAPMGVTVAEMQSAAADEAQHMAHTRRLNLSIAADWNAFAENGYARAFAFDAMENAARALDRFSAPAAARDALARRVDSLFIATSSRLAIKLNGKTLVVTFDPSRGYLGRPSSRAIARTLATLLFVPQKPG